MFRTEALVTEWSSGLTRLEKNFIQILNQIEYGQVILSLPSGNIETLTGPKVGPQVKLNIKDERAIWLLFSRGDVGFGEAYQEGLWDTDNLTRLVEFAIINQKPLEKILWKQTVSLFFAYLKHRKQNNSLTQSRKNIAAHYDLGNTFYAHWLDPSMTYSSALFEGDLELSLEQAQQQKYQKMLDQLQLPKGSHILEVGCGWGGFAEHAAKRGYQVTGVTISKEQFDYAERRLAPYQNQCNILLQDYRKLEGEFDGIVSIEMFEAVGKEYWNTYFKKINSLLKPGAKAVIQTITINDQDFANYSKNTDFIQQYIFPGGFLPSPARFSHVATKNGLEITSAFSFGKDYAETLRRWRLDFNQKHKEMNLLGFDDEFIRLWNYYFCYCEGGFLREKTNVFQFLLQKPQ